MNFMIGNLSIYDFVAMFFVYAFIGWWVEVVFHVVAQGIVVNRGFINGPLCPIYGCGMLAVLEILLPYTGNSWIMFFGGMLLCSLIELIGGYALYHFFHQRWWDYSDEHFNIGGYVCLRFSLAWGFAIAFVMEIVHPTIYRLVHLVPVKIGSIILIILVVIGLIDLTATVITVMKMKREFERLDAIAGKIRKVSDALTEHIGESTIKAETRIEEARVQAALGKAELSDRTEAARDIVGDKLYETKRDISYIKEDLGNIKEITKSELETLLVELKEMQAEAKAGLSSKVWFGSGRIMKAFPDLLKRK